MSRSSTSRGLVLRSMAVGGVAVVLATGPAGAADTPPGAPAPETPPAVSSRSDLAVSRIDPDAASPGGTTTVRALVWNIGPQRTANPFNVVITLPPGVTPEGEVYPDNCAAFQGGHRLRCVFPAGLPAYRTATARINVRLAADVPVGTLTGGWVSVRGLDDKNPDNNKQPFELPVVAGN